MIKIGDRVVHMGEGYGTVRHILRGKNIVLVKWDNGLCTEHYLPAIRKVTA
jgi:hypothetical protein